MLTHTHTLIIINHLRVQTENGMKLNLLMCVLRACVSARRSWLLWATPPTGIAAPYVCPGGWLMRRDRRPRHRRAVQ